jgi:hypothetical protein
MRVDFIRAILPLLALLSLLSVERTAFGQDLTFEPDEVEEIDTQDLQFDEEAVPEIDADDSALPVITGLFVPNEQMSSEDATRLSEFLVRELAGIPGVESVSNEYLMEEFEIMGAELARECAFDPVCLGRVGWEVGLDQVVVGRASLGRNPGQFGVTLDLVDLSSRSVLRYRFFESEDDLVELTDAIERQLPYLFDIRQGPVEYVEVDEGPGLLQVSAAWSSLALGLSSLGVGLYFGLDASSREEDVRNSSLREGDIYLLTQVQARYMLDEAEDSALMSNVLIGTGAVLLGVSSLLFFITPGSDIDTQVNQTASVVTPGNSILLPQIGKSGWGITGAVDF